MKIKLFRSTLLLFLLVGLLFLSVPANAKHNHHKKFTDNPIIFVHGFAGSASQFESQAMRFMSNGYPKNHLYAFEYDTSSGLAFLYYGVPESIFDRLDDLITQVLSVTGKSQVNLMGHSLGTVVSQSYLKSSPERSKRVSNYINIDGFSDDAELLGGADTLALWAGIGRGGLIVGGQNITIANQTHVQVATSAESFLEMYRFFTGKDPKTTMVIPRRGKIEIAGRACLFPQNIGVEGATLEVYKVSGFTGKRLHKKAYATFAIGEDGNFGPIKVRAGDQFEFVIIREGQDHHVYKEPFLRSDYFVRLQTSPVGGGIGASVDTDPGQSNLVVTRDKELWGESPLESDILAVNGVNVINAANSPLSNRTTAIYLFDEGSDGISYLDEPLAFFHELAFMTGADLFIPADDPPKNKIRLTMIPRGGNGLMQVINVPNWSSDKHRISVLFNDFVQWDNIP